jgi:hypothetical protein
LVSTLSREISRFLNDSNDQQFTYGQESQLRAQALLIIDCSQYTPIRMGAFFSFIVNQRHFFFLPFFSLNENVGSSLQDEVQNPQLRRQAFPTYGRTQYFSNRALALFSLSVNQGHFLTAPLSRGKEKLESSSHGPSKVGDEVGGFGGSVPLYIVDLEKKIRKKSCGSVAPH